MGSRPVPSIRVPPMSTVSISILPMIRKLHPPARHTFFDGPPTPSTHTSKRARERGKVGCVVQVVDSRREPLGCLVLEHMAGTIVELAKHLTRHKWPRRRASNV